MITGIVVATVQYAVSYLARRFVLLAPFWGGLLGGSGAGLYLAMQKAGRGKEDAAREGRFVGAIAQHDVKGFQDPNDT